VNPGERSAGIVIGTVTAVKDPKKLGRIQVSYPFLDEQEKRWVPVGAPMAGDDRGIFVMPEIGDEAIVAFDQGMWDHPYVIGFLWNPQQKPPSPDERQRMIRSKNGHTIRFVDTTPNAGNKGALIIEDAHGNSIVMSNTQVIIHSRGHMALSAASMSIMNRLVKPVGGEI
jgi:uncharacterized protein involved in type VI secretion and phage assembly